MVHTVWASVSIKATRACIDAILDGSIKTAKFTKDPVFGFSIPKSLPGVEAKVLNPREAWEDKAAYDATRVKLAKLYIENFKEYMGVGKVDYSDFGPKI